MSAGRKRVRKDRTATSEYRAVARPESSDYRDNSGRPKPDTHSVGVGVARVLREARELIRIGWSRGEFAVDEDGVPYHQTKKPIVAYSFVGAIQEAGEGGIDAWRARKILSDLLWVVDLGEWSEHPLRKKRDLLKAFDQALCLVEPKRRGSWSVTAYGGAR